MVGVDVPDSFAVVEVEEVVEFGGGDDDDYVVVVVAAEVDGDNACFGDDDGGDFHSNDQQEVGAEAEGAHGASLDACSIGLHEEEVVGYSNSPDKLVSMQEVCGPFHDDDGDRKDSAGEEGDHTC